MRVAGVLAAAFAGAAVVAVAIAAEEWQFHAYESRRYVVASGVVGTPFSYEILVSAPEIGTYRVHRYDLWDVPPAGGTLRVMVNPRDPTDLLAWEDRARPWVPTAVAGGLAVASLACVAVAAVVVHRGRMSPEPALDAAAPPMEPDAPSAVPVPERVSRKAPPVSLGLVVLGGVGLAAILAFPTGVTEPEYFQAPGRVVLQDAGPAVHFFDAYHQKSVTRPLTSEEARRLKEGDPYFVTYAVDRDGDQFSVNPPNLALAALWVGVLWLRRFLWWLSLERLPGRRAEAVAVAGWLRMHHGSPWLALAPYGSTRVRDVVLVPLDHMAPVPDALRNILWVRGRLRRGRAVLVHSRDGEAWWPVGRARGPLAAALLGPSPWAPEPSGLPRGVPPEAEPGQRGA